MRGSLFSVIAQAVVCIFVVALTVTAVYNCIGYDLTMLFGVTAPWFVRVGLMFISFGVPLPLAIILWLLHFIAGMRFPLF